MLDPFSRGAMLALPLCVAALIALAPVRARSSIEERAPAVLSLPLPAASDPDEIVAITRDPFAEPAASPVAATLPASSAVGEASLRADAVGALPSNLASDPIPAIPGSGRATGAAIGGGAATLAGDPRITAIVTGAHPFALVETAGVHEIKGLGDQIAGQPIVGIDLDGIRLQNGARLSVDRTNRQ